MEVVFISVFSIRGSTVLVRDRTSVHCMEVVLISVFSITVHRGFSLPSNVMMVSILCAVSRSS